MPLSRDTKKLIIVAIVALVLYQIFRKKDATMQALKPTVETAEDIQEAVDEAQETLDEVEDQNAAIAAEITRLTLEDQGLLEDLQNAADEAAATIRERRDEIRTQLETLSEQQADLARKYNSNVAALQRRMPNRRFKTYRALHPRRVRTVRK